MMQSTSLIWHSLFSVVRGHPCLSRCVCWWLTFLCTRFSRTRTVICSCPVFCCKRLSGRPCVFLTPVTWTKLGMFSAVGALYGTQLSLKDLRLSNVATELSTRENSEDIRFGTVSTLSRWRGRHNFLPNPAISWKVAFDFFMQSVGSTYSDVLHEVGRRRPVRPFRVLYKRMAAAEVHRWEGYLESRVQAKGWDRQLLRSALRRLPRSVPQAHGWFLLKVHLNAPGQHRNCWVGRCAICG